MRKLLIALGVVAVAGVPGAWLVNRWVESFVLEKAVHALRSQYGSDLEFSSLNVQVLPRIVVTGRDLRFFHKGRRDVPPLISIRSFEARTGLLQLVRAPRHVHLLRLDGLTIQVPPDRGGLKGKDGGRNQGGPPRQDTPVVVDELISDGALVRILPKKAGKTPLEFDIHQLRMEAVGLDRPAPFRAQLRNAKPPGEIAVRGQFGPWQRDEPGQTPLGASYEFKDANLGVFKGISGILSSTGKFQGVLERIEVDGETHTPDFAVSVAGHPVRLDTKFHAIVDGTNGETLLKPVRAQVGETTIVADGGVVETPGRKGRTVTLDVTVESGRIQDLMLLAVKAQPPMTGAIGFRCDFELPPGDIDIAQKLRLDGNFGIRQGRFTKLNIQEKVNELSRRGRGEEKKDEMAAQPPVASDFGGQFRLRDGSIRFSRLHFNVPGAAVRLNGTFGLENEQLDFEGRLLLTAKPSDMTSGVKSFLLKLVDPFVSDHQAGTNLPIRITGTRKDPSFKVQVGKLLTGD